MPELRIPPDSISVIGYPPVEFEHSDDGKNWEPSNRLPKCENGIATFNLIGCKRYVRLVPKKENLEQTVDEQTDKSV